MARLTKLSFVCVLCCVMGLGAATVPANAQNAALVVQANPYAQQLLDSLKRSEDAVANAGSRLGTALSDALQAKQVAKLAVIIKCDRYHLIEVTYRDRSIKVVDDPRALSGRNEPVDRDQLKTLAATLPGFTWSEIDCEE